jgi:tRNA (adenine57-N1/adenine58-N1)-methyltransferase
MREGCCVDTICEGCLVLLEIDEKRKFVFRVRRGAVQGSDRGILRHDDIIGLDYGSTVTLSTGVKAVVHRPRLLDMVERGFSRRSQVIYPKDQGLILFLAGIGPGSKVVEVGVGSGFTTAFLAWIVGPQGHVYAYEVREDMIEVARKNLELLGLTNRVTIHRADARKGIRERNVDAVIADIPDPWNILDPAYEALRGSGVLVAFMPSVNQLVRFTSAVNAHPGFSSIRVVEVMLREYEVRGDALRPKTTMIAHTGYVASARKVLQRG